MVTFFQICESKGITSDFSKLRVLVLKSNPLLTDSDFDGRDDILDDDPANAASTEIDVVNIDDTDIFNNKNYVNSPIDDNGKIEYVNLYGSNSVKKPVITYTRYPNVRKNR